MYKLYLMQENPAKLHVSVIISINGTEFLPSYMHHSFKKSKILESMFMSYKF